MVDYGSRLMTSCLVVENTRPCDSGSSFCLVDVQYNDKEIMTVLLQGKEGT